MSQELIQDLLVGMFPTSDITIPAQEPRLGEGTTKLILHFLGTGTKKLDPLASTLGTNMGHLPAIITPVTNQILFR